MNTQVEIVDSPERWSAVREEWWQLIRQNASATPFHAPEWLITWWRHFGSGQLMVALLWSGQQLRGVLPAFLHTWNGSRQLTLVGTGITDYLEPLVNNEDLPLALSEIAGKTSWERIVWQDLPACSPLAETRLWPGFGLSIQPDVPISSIPLTGSFDDYWAARSKDLRRNLRRYGDRAAALAPLAFHYSNFFESTVIEELFRLHAQRWGRRGEPGTVEANGSAEFLRAACRELADAGRLRVYWLTWGEKIVAASIGFEWDAAIFSYLSAFDPEREDLGFGRVLLYRSLRHSWARNIERWHFLRGEESYKQSWGALFSPRVRITVTR